MKVYIAGPYTKGDVAVNVANTIKAADAIIQKGHIPYIPHLTHFWHLVSPHPIMFWYAYDIQWLDDCEFLLRLQGESTGADMEVEYAHKHAIAVFYSVDDIPEALQ